VLQWSHARTTRAEGIFLHSHIPIAGGKSVVLGLTLALFGCAIYRPRPAGDLNSLAQVRTQTDGKVRISAAVLSAEQSEKVFGVPVYDTGVQPVWISIENQDRAPYAFLSGSVD
jgi:hypothetical protein